MLLCMKVLESPMWINNNVRKEKQCKVSRFETPRPPDARMKHRDENAKMYNKTLGNEYTNVIMSSSSLRA